MTSKSLKEAHIEAEKLIGSGWWEPGAITEARSHLWYNLTPFGQILLIEWTMAEKSSGKMAKNHLPTVKQIEEKLKNI